jgi:hypothetical protein
MAFAQGRLNHIVIMTLRCIFGLENANVCEKNKFHRRISATVCGNDAKTVTWNSALHNFLNVADRNNRNGFAFPRHTQDVCNGSIFSLKLF